MADLACGTPKVHFTAAGEVALEYFLGRQAREPVLMLTAGRTSP